ncbi:HEXXH motif domain-containing protein [Amycolatopsis sp. cmx-8-4]|uniref:HEXXH motif domain-containing protein n=1 Tax=Amycolatopsis sp. cmx-8-4 TaxID=2790947 RepID=UPI00397E86A9
MLIENPEQNEHAPELAPHHLPWSDFDALARGEGGPGPVQKLRAAERSRRLLLLRGLIDIASKSHDRFGPLSSPESAWELLTRVQHAAPEALELTLAHPYTGTWAGYTTRLFHQQVTGVCPIWVHVGHVHCLAAAAAVHAGLQFDIDVPVWQGNVSLPTLGMAHLATDEPFSVAEVHGRDGEVTVENWYSRVLLPADRSIDVPAWSGIREATAQTEGRRLSVRLDDLDPYRGLYEPVPPRRLTIEEVESWRTVVGGAWDLLVRHLPEVADALPDGLDSLVPAPAVPFRQPSASSGEAFGSAIIAHSEDPASLAAALVHEFHHIRLGGLQHLTAFTTADPRERLYAPWRDDPRPIAGVLHGIYAFFGVTGFWRRLASADPNNELAAFEFALWRGATWNTLRVVRRDAALTDAGRRFLDGVTDRLGPWQEDPITPGPAAWAAAIASDHYAGWRVRHLRPIPGTVTELVRAWRADHTRPNVTRLLEPESPTPVPDGTWPDARADLVRLRLSPDGAHRLATNWSSVRGASAADFDYAAGRTEAAIAGYRAELSKAPDSPSALVGLGLALSTRGTSPAARALMHRPELVRAVHRRLRAETRDAPSPETVAAWIGRFTH